LLHEKWYQRRGNDFAVEFTTEDSMKFESWARYLVTAALVLLVGAVWALADETMMNVKVRSDNGQELTIDVNGVSEVVKLEDLAEGEERTYTVGGHDVTVTRINDRLSLVHDGMVMGDDAVWVTAGEEGLDGGRRVVIKQMGDGELVDVDTETVFIGEGDHDAHDVFVIKGDDGEIDVEALKEKYGDDCEVVHTGDGKCVMKWVSKGGDEQPLIVKRMHHVGDGEFVSYRCEETGSTLTVKADENLLDDYIDPVTGCVMTKVDDAGVRVITIREERITDDEDE
jgi:hypothetical protein